MKHRGGIWFVIGDLEIHMGTENIQDREISRRHVERQRLTFYGIEIEEAIPIPGWDRCYCRDPFGNRIEFIQRID
ncbi:MAG: hypothetical protein ABIL52_05675 [candidate division WOR-3 bacterium]